MVKICFLGGADIKKESSKPIHKRAFKEAGRAPSLLVFPWTNQIEKRKYRKIMNDYFKDCGARTVKFGELTDSLRELQRKISFSDAIYLPGGDPRILTKRMRRIGLIPLLKQYKGIIIGNSAGSLALCMKYAVIKGQDGEPKTKLIDGLGVVEFSIAVHYKSLNKEYPGDKPDYELGILSRETNSKIYAIPENGALFYDTDKLKFVGNIYVFNKGKRVKCRQRKEVNRVNFSS